MKPDVAFALMAFMLMAIVAWGGSNGPVRARGEATSPAPPKGHVICPFAPPCWQDGEPIVGALGRG